MTSTGRSQIGDSSPSGHKRMHETFLISVVMLRSLLDCERAFCPLLYVLVRYWPWLVNWSLTVFPVESCIASNFSVLVAGL